MRSQVNGKLYLYVVKPMFRDWVGRDLQLPTKTDGSTMGIARAVREFQKWTRMKVVVTRDDESYLVCHNVLGHDTVGESSGRIG